MDDDWYQSRSPDWDKVKVPFLSPASWAGFGLHPRGNFEAFTQAASKEKWLEGHPGRHEEWFYLEYGMELQKRFFDYYLKGEKNGWNKEPRVWVNLRRPFTDDVELRKESEWPLKGTKWTKLFLDAGGKGKLDWKAPKAKRGKEFRALTRGITWRTAPLERETEITGPMVAKLYVSSTTEDCDLFVTMQAFSDKGREVHFQGTVDPKTPLAQGWLRVSHRKLDAEKSEPWRPYHTHDDKQMLIPGEIYEVDVEIWPQCIVLPKGFQIALNISGQDFDRPGPAVDAYVPSRGSGVFLHDHPTDRPKEIFGGKTTDPHRDRSIRPTCCCRSFRRTGNRCRRNTTRKPRRTGGAWIEVQRFAMRRRPRHVRGRQPEQTAASSADCVPWRRRRRRRGLP